jgi:pimeloyl-ACP methyl ester carboxylesterase
MRVLYLHGFASSPLSSKAAFFAEKLGARGIPFDAPDLNQPDFSTLTVSRMLDQAGRVIDASGGPVTVMGSSLGGFVAVHAALRYPALVHRVVLLAPALEVRGERLSELGDRSLHAWQSSDRLDVFHYAYGRTMPVHYELYADAERYNAFDAQLTQPVQVFQGRRDSAVDPDTVAQWAAARPYVELHLLDDDHQLHGSLDYIWRELDRFLHQQMP